MIPQLPTQELIDTAINHPVASVVLAAVLFLATSYLRTVKPTEALHWARVKTAVVPLADYGLRRVTRGRLRRFTTDVTDRGDYITTANASVFAVVVALFRAGYRWNPISTVKYVTEDGGYRRWARIQLAYRGGYGKQHHVYLFVSYRGVDVYGHLEDSITDPDDHVSGDQIRGDPNGRAQAALEDAQVSTERS
jgi:hypothetical protein